MAQEKLFKDFYNSYWDKRTKADFRYRYNVFLSWIKEGKKVLDIGCGDGYLAKMVKDKKNCDVTAIDISDTVIERVKKLGIKALVANIEDNLPFEDNSFDYVIATEVIEHLAFSEEAIKEMVRVSRQYILLSIPNIAHFKHRLTLLMGNFPKQWVINPVEHLRYWSVSDFKKTINDLNLKIVDIKAGSGRRYLRDIWPNLFAEQVCFLVSKK